MCLAQGWIEPASERLVGQEDINGPKQDADQPEPQAEAERLRQRAVEDGDRARGAAKQDGSVSARWRGAVNPGTGSSISAPPPKEKKERKKLEAAKAMLRPKTIWMRRRKPPNVSAMSLATGPSMD
jgi:hypothetical protein